MDSTSISSGSSKAVVGVALAVAFGAGIYSYGVRSGHDAQVAQVAAIAAPAPTAPPAAEPALAPPGTTEGSSGQMAAAAPSPVPAAATAATPAPSSDTAPDQPKVAHHGKRSSAASSDAASNLVASTGKTATASPQASDGNPGNAAPAPAEATPPPTASNDTPAPAADGASDTKLTTDVKTQIAAAAPSATVNVTASNGAVALSGSVPSQDALSQAKLAAQSVDGVKTVDTSGLLVSNNP
jgi:hypothetical protein